jgi:hypothetical protein
MRNAENVSPAAARKGRILRVKAGYNPNSSSVASELTVFLFSAAGAGLFTIAGLSVAEIIIDKMKKKPDAAPVSSAPQAEAKPQ